MTHSERTEPVISCPEIYTLHQTLTREWKAFHEYAIYFKTFGGWRGLLKLQQLKTVPPFPPKRKVRGL